MIPKELFGAEIYLLMANIERDLNRFIKAEQFYKSAGKVFNQMIDDKRELSLYETLEFPKLFENNQTKNWCAEKFANFYLSVAEFYLKCEKFDEQKFAFHIEAAGKILKSLWNQNIHSIQFTLTKFIWIRGLGYFIQSKVDKVSDNFHLFSDQQLLKYLSPECGWFFVYRGIINSIRKDLDGWKFLNESPNDFEVGIKILKKFFSDETLPILTAENFEKIFTKLNDDVAQSSSEFKNRIICNLSKRTQFLRDKPIEDLKQMLKKIKNIYTNYREKEQENPNYLYLEVIKSWLKHLE